MRILSEACLPVVFVGPGKLEDANQSHKANLGLGKQKPLTCVDWLNLAAIS